MNYEILGMLLGFIGAITPVLILILELVLLIDHFRDRCFGPVDGVDEKTSHRNYNLRRFCFWLIIVRTCLISIGFMTAGLIIMQIQ